MSLVSFFETSGRAGRVVAGGGGGGGGASWGGRDMSVQYRPDLGSISLNPQFASESPTNLKPFFLDIAMNQTSNLSPISFSQSSSMPSPAASSASAVDQPNHTQSLLSLKLDAQRQAIDRALKMKPPIPPLSPQESSIGFSDASSHNNAPHHNVESHRFRHSEGCVQSQSSSFYGENSYRAPATAFNRDVQFSDLPIVRGPAAFQSPAGSSEHRLQSSANNNNGHSLRVAGDAMLLRGDGRGNEESKRLKRTLEDLERELLADDSDLTSSIFHGEPSILGEPPERDWTDVIEDLLSSESSSFPSQTVGSSSAASLLEQSTVTCNSRMVSKDQGSEVTGQANSSAHRSAFSQRQTSPLQSFKAAADANGQPKQLLLSCAAAIADNDFELAASIVASLKQSVSIYGDPMQRLAAYMVEGLVARIESSGRTLCKALKRNEPSASDILSATHVLYQCCPYLKFGYMAANGAIAETFKNEDKVHIIDFEIGQGYQWQALIEALAARQGGPPQVRITGVDDPKSPTTPAGGLQAVGRKLTEIAQTVRVPFEFIAVQMEVSQVEPWMLEKREGEALAVNFAFQLHHMPDESVHTTNPRDRLLRMVRKMEPKVVTLVEHEANTNTAPFYPRFVEALSYYTAVFDSLDASLPRGSRDRVNAEQHCLAQDIVNIIACEGSDRIERYELAGKWRARMSMAGFRPSPLSSYINGTINTLLQNYSSNYRLREDGGVLYLGWLDRVLIVASAWQL